MFGKAKTPKTPKVKLSDLCHTRQADIERIVNGATIPVDAPKWQVTTRAARPKRSRR